MTVLFGKSVAVCLIHVQVAARNNHCEVIRVLVGAGANVQERNGTTQWVALHEAAFRGNVEACEMLLFVSAPVQPRTLDGELPRDLAKRYGKTEVVKLLGKCDVLLCTGITFSPYCCLKQWCGEYKCGPVCSSVNPCKWKYISYAYSAL